MEFRILGPLEAHDGIHPLPVRGSKRRALLAILLLHANEVVPRERLIDELWGEQPPDTAAKSLQMHVSALRKALEGGGRTRTLLTAPRGYMLSVGPGALDLDRFEHLCADARAAQAEGRVRDSVRLMREALALWRGPALAEFAEEAFARIEGPRLEELRLAATEDCIRAQLEVDDPAALVAELEALVAEHPLRERAQELLMLALYRSGRQAEALAAYRHARDALVGDLGIEPGRELRRLEQAILRQDPELDAPASERPERPEPAAGAFVGRGGELIELDAALADALAGRGRLVLVAGEPGIGKTRLAEELASRARGRGALVLAGRCWEAGGAPAYWPWLQAIRSYLREQPEEQVRRELGRGAAELAGILPELADLVPGTAPAPIPDSEHARFRVFQATADFLRSATSGRAALLVLDDLHAADAPSLLLLRFLARELPDMRLLVVGAFRDTEPSGLGDWAAELAREPHCSLIELQGLHAGEVARYVELTAAGAPPDVVSAIQDRADGNPLFVAELVRLYASSGRTGALPGTVRGVIERRLCALAPECRETLVLAAVLGREFGLDALAELAGLGADELAEHLDDALAAGLLAGIAGSPHRLRFSHVLVRDALYETISPARRGSVHRRAGRALERAYEADREPHLAELAHHFVEGAREGDAGEAASYARRAADRAARLFAHEEAARLYSLALRTLALDGHGHSDAGCDVLLALGETQARAGEVPDARRTFLRAAELAQELELPERFARAALGYGGRYVHRVARGDPHLVPLLERALGALPPGHDALRAKLLARLSGALGHSPERERRVELSSQAVRLARQAGDGEALAFALVARMMTEWGPDNPAERIALGTEIVHLAEELGDLERLHQGHMFRVHALIELGDMETLESELQVSLELTDRLRQPPQQYYAWGVLPMLALLRGRFADVPELIERVQAVGRRLDTWNRDILALLQRFLLTRETSAAAEALEAIDTQVATAAAATPAYPIFECVRLNIDALLGREAEARSRLRRLARDGLAALGPERQWLGEDRLLGVALLAEACPLAADERAAELLYERHKGYGHLNATGTIEIGLGSFERYLGLLAAARGRDDEAVAHLEAAVAANERMGARPWVAHSREDLAGVLCRRGGPGDAERAKGLLDSALAGYRELGMAGAERRALTTAAVA